MFDDQCEVRKSIRKYRPQYLPKMVRPSAAIGYPLGMLKEKSKIGGVYPGFAVSFCKSGRLNALFSLRWRC
jgi:hypothetical protein